MPGRARLGASESAASSSELGLGRTVRLTGNGHDPGRAQAWLVEARQVLHPRLLGRWRRARRIAALHEQAVGGLWARVQVLAGPTGPGSA